MNVLSLFDGISCGRIALDRAKIKVDKYFASEIDKNAIKVASTNFPNNINLGDVNNWRSWDLPKIDLLIGGSPCQGFSSAGKGLNFSDPRSKLFFKYVEILNYLKKKNPNILFLLENVKMKPEWQDIITSYLGVEPIEINSSLVSAQNRVRLYWTNIKGITQPKDKNITLQSILEDKIYINKATILGRRINEKGHRQDYDKTIPITQCLEVRDINRNKSNCLTTVDKDNVLTSLPIGRYIDAYGLKVYGPKIPFRYYTRSECEKLQTLPVGYTNSIKESYAKKALGNGWTVEVIAHIFSFINT